MPPHPGAGLIQAAPKMCMSGALVLKATAPLAGLSGVDRHVCVGALRITGLC